MAAKGEDTYTQIQKYKAKLKSARHQKGEQEMAKKPKKKKLRKENVNMESENTSETPCTSSLATADSEMAPCSPQNRDSCDEGVISTEIEPNSVVLQESEQTSDIQNHENAQELICKDPELIKEPIEAIPIQEKEANDQPDKEKPKKEKSKALSSIRRKRKKSKSKPEDSSEKVTLDEEKKEECVDEDRASEGDEVREYAPKSMLPKSPINADNSLDSKEETKKSELVDSEEKSPGKATRTQKFKRWASFTKHKKANDSTSNEKETKDDESGPAEDETTGEPSEHGEIASKLEGFEGLPKPEKEPKRSVSLNEITDLTDPIEINNALPPDANQHTRSASFGQETLPESFVATSQLEESSSKLEENQVKDEAETNSNIDDKIADLEIKNSSTENNEIANEPDLMQQKSGDNSVKDGELPPGNATAPGGINTQEIEPEVQVTASIHEKKKKKKFLRKISSKSLKPNKKENRGEEQKGAETKVPLLATKSNAGTEDGATAEEIGEKSFKRKKNVLNIKLPKALKRRKSSEYKVIAGAETEKEIKKDETFNEETEKDTSGNTKLEDVEEVEGNTAETVEEKRYFEKSCEDLVKDDQVQEEVVEEEELYAFCRSVMNDVIGELIGHVQKLDRWNEEDEDKYENKIDLLSDAEQTSNVELKKKEVHFEIPEKEVSDEQLEPIEESENLEEPKRNDTNVAHYSDEEIPNLSENENASLKTTESTSEESKDQSNETTQSVVASQEGTLEEINDQSIGSTGSVVVHLSQESILQESNDQSIESTGSVVVHLSQESTPEESKDMCNENIEHAEINSTNEISEEISERAVEAPNQCADVAEENSGRFDVISTEVGDMGRSIEISMKTKALIDSYILINQSLEFSQGFFKQVEMMALSGSEQQKSRCSIM